MPVRNSSPAPLAYVAAGDPGSQPVVFLHGFMGSLEDWREVIKSLQDGFHCIAVDLPGHGDSKGLPAESYTMEGTASSVIEVFDILDIERTTLVGYSMGGRLALYLALRYPERCLGLFFESASPGLENPGEREARRELDEERAQRLESEDLENFLQDWYRQPLFASLARDEELLQQTIEARRHNDPGELAKSLRGMGTGSQPSLWDELPELRVPTLAVAGALDDKYVELAQRMAAASPMISSTVVPGAGHNVHVETTELYLETLRQFLEKIIFS